MTWRVFLPDLTTYDVEIGILAEKVPLGTWMHRLGSDYWCVSFKQNNEYRWNYSLPPKYLKALNLIL